MLTKLSFNLNSLVSDIDHAANVKLAAAAGSTSKSQGLSNTMGGKSNVAKVKSTAAPVIASQPPVNDLIPKMTTAINAGVTLDPISPIESGVPRPPTLPML
jgi:hypothetical protein